MADDNEDFQDEGLIDVERLLDVSEGLFDQIDGLDKQAVKGIQKMLDGALMLGDSLAEDTILDRTIDVDGK